MVDGGYAEDPKTASSFPLAASNDDDNGQKVARSPVVDHRSTEGEPDARGHHGCYLQPVASKRATPDGKGSAPGVHVSRKERTDVPALYTGFRLKLSESQQPVSRFGARFNVLSV